MNGSVTCSRRSRCSQLDKLYRHDVETKLPSGNWKATADGYLDGYHLGYLHRNTIGAKSITNRNTYDLYGPHVRIGFANKPIAELRDIPPEEWPDNVRVLLARPLRVPEHLDLRATRAVADGQPDLPGPRRPRVDGDPVPVLPRAAALGDEAIADAEAKRQQYADVTYEEDFLTVMAVTRRVDVLAEAGDVFRFGRNEIGNQNLHHWIERLLAEPARPADDRRGGDSVGHRPAVDGEHAARSCCAPRRRRAGRRPRRPARRCSAA